MNNDETTLARMAQELASQPPMEVEFQAGTILQLTGLLQLALRHPDLSETVRETGEDFIDAVRVYFSDCPATLDVIRRGSDPTEDR